MFSSLKAAFKKNLAKWHNMNIGKSLTKYTVVPVLFDATEYLLHHKPGVISSGFRRAGLVPWNVDSVDTTKMLPSLVFDKQSG